MNVLERGLLTLFLILSPIVLFQLACRNAWLSLIAAGLIQLIASKKNTAIKPIYKKTIITLSIIYLFIALLTLTMKTFNGSWIHPEKLLLNTHSFTQRLNMWQFSLQQIPHHFWFGHGWGSFSYPANLTYVHPHNTYLYLLFSGGIIVFLNYLTLFLIASKNKLQTLSNSLYLSPLLVILIGGLFDHISHTVEPQLLLFILLAGLHKETHQFKWSKN